MSHRTTDRVLAAGALALALALAGATPAQARELGGPAGVWQRLARAWESGLSLLWPSTTLAESGLRGITQKEGLGVDPNGSPKPAPGGTGNVTCGVCGETGLEINPDG
ncbi:MAG: hypothetical protein ACLGI9_10715 [Thermoanaerobaculia bacterium]